MQTHTVYYTQHFSIVLFPKELQYLSLAIVPITIKKYTFSHYNIWVWLLSPLPSKSILLINTVHDINVVMLWVV